MICNLESQILNFQSEVSNFQSQIPSIQPLVRGPDSGGEFFCGGKAELLIQMHSSLVDAGLIRPAPGEAQLRAAEHRALRAAEFDQLRLAERADPRVLRPRRDGRADRPVRPAVPAARDVGPRALGRREDGADERAVDARDLARDARLDHRPAHPPRTATVRPPDRGTTTRSCRWCPARGGCRSARAPAT